MIQEELLQKVIETIAEAFEIDPGTIQPASRLNEDLDIDSIDAVDLLIRLKPLAGRRLQPRPSSPCARYRTWSTPCMRCQPICP